MIKFANVEFRGLKKEDLLEDIGQIKFIATMNAELIVRANEDERFRKIIKNCICTFDGQIPYILAKFLNQDRCFEKISGSDFIYSAAEHAFRLNKSIYLLGGKRESNFKAVGKLKELYPGLRIDGYSPPFSNYPFVQELEIDINSRLMAFKPDYIFVGFGAGKQEEWINDHLDLLSSCGVKLVIGSGGTFEFVSGIIKRAPRFLQKIGLEGVFRFFVEPKFFRLKRLVLSFKIFKYLY